MNPLALMKSNEGVTAEEAVATFSEDKPESLPKEPLSADAFDLLAQVTSINNTALHTTKAMPSTLKKKYKKKRKKTAHIKRVPADICTKLMALMNRRGEITIKDAVSAIKPIRSAEAYRVYLSLLCKKGLVFFDKRNTLTSHVAFYRVNNKNEDAPKYSYDSTEKQLLAITRERGRLSLADAAALITPERNYKALIRKFKILVDRGLIRCEKYPLNGRFQNSQNVYFDATLPPLHEAHVVTWQKITSLCAQKHPKIKQSIFERRQETAIMKMKLLSLIRSRKGITHEEAASVITERDSATLADYFDFFRKKGWVYYERKTINSKNTFIYKLTNPREPLPLLEDIMGVSKQQLRVENIATQILELVAGHVKITTVELLQLITPPTDGETLNNVCKKLMEKGLLRREQFYYGTSIRGKAPFVYSDATRPPLHDAHVIAWEIAVFKSNAKQNGSRSCRGSSPRP
jgi:hypothetical protein